MTHALFLDTMTYLHYQPVEQIDWHQVLGVSRADEVLIVVPGITLREIDKHKNHTPRLRDRAQKVGARLAAWISAGSSVIRPGVRVVSAPRKPNVDFEAEGLDRTQNDDVLVATALEYRRNNSGVTVVIVTQDSYPRVIAQGHGLETHALADDLKLPVEEDATEKENRILRRRIQQLEGARPDLNLEFSSGSKTLEVTIRLVHPLTEEELAEAMQAVEQQYPTAESFRSAPLAAPQKKARPKRDAGAPPTDLAALGREISRAQEFQRTLRSVDAGDLERYAAERSTFLEEHAAYLRAARAFDVSRARRFTLELELVNTGSMPAADVDVRLHVPDGVIVADRYDSSEPEPPEAPTLPRTTGELVILGMQTPHIRTVGDILGEDSLFPLADVFGTGRRKASSLDIEETGSFTIKWHIDRVKHGLRAALPKIYVSIPEASPVRPFQITYALHAANLPEAATGTLNVVLKSEPGSAAREPS